MGILVDSFNNATVEEQERMAELLRAPEPDRLDVLEKLLADALQRIRTLEQVVLHLAAKTPLQVTAEPTEPGAK